MDLRLSTTPAAKHTPKVGEARAGCPQDIGSRLTVGDHSYAARYLACTHARSHEDVSLHALMSAVVRADSRLKTMSCLKDLPDARVATPTFALFAAFAGGTSQ